MVDPKHPIWYVLTLAILAASGWLIWASNHKGQSRPRAK